MLWLLNQHIPLQDIFAYADDVLVLCDDLETLHKCIKVIEDWSEENNMKINKTKSAIMEFSHRRLRKKTLVVGEKLLDYPIVDQYKYLGTWLNPKLNCDTHLKQIITKTNIIRKKLSPILYSTSLEMRKNLWQVFIIPLYEFILPLYHYEPAQTKKDKMELSLRNSFKSFTGFKKGVSTNLINDLMGYNMNQRSTSLLEISELKWYQRENRNSTIQPLIERPKAEKKFNLCKFQSKIMVKYINMQTSLCPNCKEIHRCSKDHLKNAHSIEIKDIYEFSESIQEFLKMNKINKKQKQNKPAKLKRNEILNYVNNLIQPDVETLQVFLNSGSKI